MSRPKVAGRGFFDLLLLTGSMILLAMPALAAQPSTSPSASADPIATASATAAPTTAPAATAAPSATVAPSATAAPAATVAPAATAEPEEPDEDDESAKPQKPSKAAKTPANDVTFTGTIATRTDGEGNTEYTMVAGGGTLVLDAGPPWFHGNDHPLKAFVGERVTITGSQRAGEAEVDVEAVNGTRLRAAGKPPWAGGWKSVGERHPGWTQEKWDRWQTKAKALGIDCFPPGQCKDGPGKRGASSGDMTGADAGG